MSVRFDASADVLSKTTGTGATSGSAMSVCCWCKRQVDNGAFSTVVYFNNVTSTLEDWLETEAGGDVLHFFEDPATESDCAGPTLTIGTWFFVGFVRQNTTRSLYYGTEAGGTLTKVTNTDTRNSNTGTVDKVYIGNDPFTEPFNGDIAWVRFWESALSDADMDAEWRSATPVKTGIRGDWRLSTAATAGTDSSGNSLTLTVGGTLADGSANPTPPASGGAKSKAISTLAMVGVQ